MPQHKPYWKSKQVDETAWRSWAIAKRSQTSTPIVPTGIPTSFGPKWPSHVSNDDLRDASYLNDMTDAILTLQGLVDSLVDKNTALQERIELLEDEIASQA